MIARYTHPEMGAIWSDQRRYETWLEVEIAAADAMAEAGHRPRRGRRANLRAKAAFDIARIEEIEADHPARRHCVHDRRGRESRSVGALAALRPDLLRRRRHRAGAADARGLRR